RGAQPKAPRLALAPGAAHSTVVHAPPLPRPAPRRVAHVAVAIPHFVPAPAAAPVVTRVVARPHPSRAARRPSHPSPARPAPTPTPAPVPPEPSPASQPEEPKPAKHELPAHPEH